MGDDEVNRALVEALTGPVPGEGAEHDLTLEQLAERAQLPAPVLEALEREKLLVARMVDGQPRYSTADAELLGAGMAVLEAGVPLDELLALARRHEQALQDMAADAVELFARFVRDPIQGSSSTQQEASERLVTAFREMLPATGAIISHRFRRLLLAAATERLLEP